MCVCKHDPLATGAGVRVKTTLVLNQRGPSHHIVTKRLFPEYDGDCALSLKQVISSTLSWYNIIEDEYDAAEIKTSNPSWSEHSIRVSRAFAAYSARACRRLGRVTRASINEITLGKRALTPDTAFRLAKLFNTTADFWMGLQTNLHMWGNAS